MCVDFQNYILAISVVAQVHVHTLPGAFLILFCCDDLLCSLVKDLYVMIKQNGYALTDLVLGAIKFIVLLSCASVVYFIGTIIIQQLHVQALDASGGNSVFSRISRDELFSIFTYSPF